MARTSIVKMLLVLVFAWSPAKCVHAQDWEYIELVLGSIDTSTYETWQRLNDIYGPLFVTGGPLSTGWFNSIHADLAAVDDGLDNVRVDLGEGASPGANSVNARLISVNSKLSDMLGSLDSVVAAVEHMDATIDDVVSAYLPSIQTSASQIATRINTTNSKLDTLISDLGTIKTKVTSIQADVADYLPNLDSIAFDTDAIRTFMGHVVEVLDDISADVAASRASLAAIQSDVADYLPLLGPIHDDVAAIRAWLEGSGSGGEPPAGLIFSEPSVEFTGALYEEGDMTIAEKMGAEAGSVKLAGIPLPHVTEQTEAPIWEFSLPITEWFGRTGLQGLQDFNISIDWSFWSPFRVLAHTLLILGFALSCASLVVEEVRKYG